MASDNDEIISRMISEKGLDAPRITLAELEANIISEYYFTGADGVNGARAIQRNHQSDLDSTDLPDGLRTTTFCVIVLRNGMTVTGVSGCISPENFDVEVGCTRARQRAVDSIWPLMGYELKQRLYESNTP
jgi:hypothetical protein